MGTKLTAKRRYIFLRDVLWLALTSFGGPQVHFLRFKKILIQKRMYLTLNELAEINSFCQMLPGPTSTQTLITIGYRKGGWVFALLTLLIWALPSTLLMTFFALFFWAAGDLKWVQHSLFFMPSLAAAFMVQGAIGFSKTMIKTKLQWAIVGSSICIYLFYTHPAVIPVLLILGGWIHSKFSGPVEVLSGIRPEIRWSNFLLFLTLFAAAALIGNILQSKPVLLFENTYRYGSLVFGGGNVLIPMFYDQFVLYKEYMDYHQFMTGVGLVQAIPGPIFSFSSYACGLALQDLGFWGILSGGLIGAVAIFTPGLLLTFFLHPIWFRLRRKALIQKSLEGINAASAGLVICAAWLLISHLPHEFKYFIVMGISLLLILSEKISPPITVLAVLFAGFLSQYF